MINMRLISGTGDLNREQILKKNLTQTVTGVCRSLAYHRTQIELNFLASQWNVITLSSGIVSFSRDSPRDVRFIFLLWFYLVVFLDLGDAR